MFAGMAGACSSEAPFRWTPLFSLTTNIRLGGKVYSSLLGTLANYDRTKYNDIAQLISNIIAGLMRLFGPGNTNWRGWTPH